MKKTILSLALLLALATSCHQPEFIESNADRQGLTSLTAIFTFGPYVNQELAKLTIEDDALDRFVIPVPFYYPPTSDDETLIYMNKVRVQAELQPNFSLTPGLTLLDLTEENAFTYTDPKGNSRTIIITGERVKSSDCVLQSFTIDKPSISGVINQDRKTVILPTKDDLSECTAKFQVSPHATIFPDPTKPRNYNEPVNFTVTAHDGTECVYTVMVGDPEKLETGINPDSVEKLFNFDPVSRLGLPDYTNTCPVSLAAIGPHLVICMGDGSTPVAINRLNGSKVGNIKLGSAVPGSITNDEMEHMLICNVAAGGDGREMLNIYRTSSISENPTLFYSFENPADCPIGHKMKVFGDIDNEAVITFTAEGVDGVTTCAKIVTVKVEGGSAKSVTMTDFASLGLGWGSAPVNVATVVPASLTPEQDGWLLDYYEGGSHEIDCLHYISGSLTDNPLWTYGADMAWAINANCLDSKSFNNVRFMALFTVSHFPCWGVGPMLYLYDINDPSSPSLLFSNDSIGWYQQGSYVCAAGDVVIAPSADGYKIYVYYYDHNSQAVGGYVADCIKR